MGKLRFVDPVTNAVYKVEASLDAVHIAEALGYIPATDEDNEKCREVRGLK